MSPGSSSGSGKSPTSSGKDIGGSRVCDSCFNTLLYESGIRQHKVLREAKEKEKADEVEKAKRKDLFGDAASVSTPISNKSEKETAVSASSGALLAAEALAERGERLQDVAEKSEILKNVSEITFPCFICL